MNKEVFLQELQKNLCVLEEQEQKDILEEYAQHIDMKMQKGLSEEEAINDFGSVQELAAGILSAYHVNPDFEEKKSKVKIQNFEKMANESKKLGESIWEWMRSKAAAVKDWTSENMTAIGRWIRKSWQKSCNRIAVLKESCFHGKTESKGAENKKRKEKLKMVNSGIKMLYNGCETFLKSCLRFSWNLFWLCMGIFSGLCMLCSLFMLGVFGVWLALDYPLIGIVLLDIGVLLCSGSASWWCFSLLIRRKKEMIQEEEYHEKIA